jgi:hypothetical protein
MNTEKLTGKKLLQTAVNQILAHPKTWNQSVWHSPCRTKHCIAGWCQILSGNPEDDNYTVRDAAQTALGISHEEAFYLFRSDCTLTEIYNFAKNFDVVGYDRGGFSRAGFSRAGFDRGGFSRAGFDRGGFDRGGFDRAGFSRAGFDRAGFSRAGFDRAGFDRAGFSRAGFDRAGFSRAGFDRDGFSRDGFDRDGYDRAGNKLKPFDL